MNIKTIKKIAELYDVRISVKKEQGKRVIGLHGFLSNIEAVAEKITGYYVEKADSGFYLYSDKANWD